MRAPLKTTLASWAPSINIIIIIIITTFNGEVNPTLFRFVFVSHKVNFNATSFPGFSPTRPYRATERERERERESTRENLGTRLNCLRSTFSFAKYCMRKSTYFVTPGVAPTVQALHLFKLFMMLRTREIIKKIFRRH